MPQVIKAAIPSCHRKQTPRVKTEHNGCRDPSARGKKTFSLSRCHSITAGKPHNRRDHNRKGHIGECVIYSLPFVGFFFFFFFIIIMIICLNFFICCSPEEVLRPPVCQIPTRIHNAQRGSIPPIMHFVVSRPPGPHSALLILQAVIYTPPSPQRWR